MIDGNGNIVPNSEIVADEKERFRLIRLREHLHGLTRRGASQSQKRLSRRRESCQDEIVKRLLKLREDYKAERHKTESRNRTLILVPFCYRRRIATGQTKVITDKRLRP